MRRLSAVFMAALIAVPAGLQAQDVQVLDPFTFDADSSAVLIGGTASAGLRVTSYCSGVGSYSITVFYDSDRLTLVAVDSVSTNGLGSLTIDSLTAGRVTISAAGGISTSCTTNLADLVFQMSAGATSGSLLSTAVNSLTNVAGSDI
ncbi:MAG: hypothetical protein ACE5FJ_09335, partial [Gemmatimonadales bacterium]